MTKAAAKVLRVENAVLARTLPFAIFMAFIALEESVRFAGKCGWIQLSGTALYYLYPWKTAAVATLLYLYRNDCPEFRVKDLAFNSTTAIACLAGVITFILWICMEWSLPAGAPSGYNPTLLPEQVRLPMAAIRVAGAVLVVPLMEELFWRSFLLRYLIDADFERVPVGRFTWSSFLVTTALFGVEHHLIVAGMVAGAIYSALLYKTRSLAQCVLAHAVTNLCLAAYVLYTGKWYFW